jgi:hypothetical protein
MKTLPVIIILTCFLSCSCNPSTPTEPLESVNLEFTAAASPWLASVYDCSGSNLISAEQRAADWLDSASFDLAIRLGQPKQLSSPAYQIGSEEILVIINHQNQINTLIPEQVRGIFTGMMFNWQEINNSNLSAPIQVWIFGSGQDVQQIFDQTVLGGSLVTSKAQLATSPDEMSQAIANDVNAIGIQTRRWKAANTTEVFTINSVPVLAITPSEPQGIVQSLVACLQK